MPSNLSISPTSDDLQDYIDHLSKHDDVFQPDFLANILLVDEFSSTDRIDLDPNHIICLYGSSILSLNSQLHHSESPVPGPYLLADGFLWRMSRLYNDVQGVFMVAVAPSVKQRY